MSRTETELAEDVRAYRETLYWVSDRIFRNCQKPFHSMFVPIHLIRRCTAIGGFNVDSKDRCLNLVHFDAYSAPDRKKKPICKACDEAQQIPF